jgi:putative hydrolase of the HAD superfamily
MLLPVGRTSAAGTALRRVEEVILQNETPYRNATGKKDMLKWIMFDLDDTLYPEIQYVKSGFRSVAQCLHARYGLDPYDVFGNLMSLFESGVRGGHFDLVREHYGLEASVVPDLVNRYREHRPDIALYPGMSALIERLRETYRLALLTDGYIETQKRKVSALAIAPLFEHIIYTDLFGRRYWKPNTYAFARFKSTCGVGDGEAVYIGDNPGKDFLPAERCGFKSVRVTWPEGIYADHPYLNGCRPDATAESIEELEEIIGRFASDSRPTDEQSIARSRKMNPVIKTHACGCGRDTITAHGKRCRCSK